MASDTARVLVQSTSTWPVTFGRKTGSTPTQMPAAITSTRPQAVDHCMTVAPAVPRNAPAIAK